MSTKINIWEADFIFVYLRLDSGRGLVLEGSNFCIAGVSGEASGKKFLE